jgi:hypothetical protein
LRKKERQFKLVVPSLFGQPIYVWSGIILFLLIIFQIITAKHWLPIDFHYHHWNGWLIFLFALGHSSFALAVYLLGAAVLQW